MYIHFTFEDGSNPYISTTNKKLFEMIRKYCLEQTGNESFHVTGKKVLWTAHTGEKVSSYEKNQLFLRDFAIEWQHNLWEFGGLPDICGWEDFFREYGKKYGLLREFEENGII